MAKKVTTEDIKERLFNRVGKEYKVISEYTKGTAPMKFFHEDCGEVFKTTPNHFFHDNRRCPCTTTRKNPYEFEKEFISISKGEYEQLSKYKVSIEKIEIKHNVCGNIFNMTPKDFLRGNRCPHCCKNKKKTTEEFSQEVLDSSDGRYLLESKYENNKTKVTIRHVECNSIYKVTPKDFLRGNRCPYCKQSKGEMKVENILKKLSIPYEIQKVYEDLRVKGKYLPYDFYLPTKNILIEYDGIQHSEPIEYFGGHKKLESQKRRDKIKDEYAKQMGINLLRIPYTYTDKEIETVVTEHVNKS